MTKMKYRKYVLPEPDIILPPRKFSQNPTFGLSEELMTGFQKLDCPFNFAGFLSPHGPGDPPHKHNCDEILFFVSTDSMNLPDPGDKVEIASVREKHTINTPAIIYSSRWTSTWSGLCQESKAAVYSWRPVNGSGLSLQRIAIGIAFRAPIGCTKTKEEPRRFPFWVCHV